MAKTPKKGSAKKPVVEVQEEALPETGEGAVPEWVSVILPDEDVQRESLRQLLVRRNVRYRLFRLQHELTHDVPAEVPEGFKEYFEAQKWFDGFENFGVTWDVGDPIHPKPRGSEDPLEVVPRYVSVQEEWEEVVDAHVKSDTIAARKRARARQMEEANGSEDNLRRDES